MSAHLWKITLVVAMTHGFRELSRRVGPKWGGLALGLPCSTAVALIGCGCDRGVDEAVAMAEGSLLGLAGAVALPLAYARSIGRGWRLPWAAAWAVAAYLVVTLVAGRFTTPPGSTGLGIAALAVLAASRMAAGLPVPPGLRRRERVAPSTGRTLAVRTLVPVGCLTATLSIGRALGPGGAGLMSTFPGLTMTVLSLTHLEAGPGAAIRMARALPLGNLGMVAFLAAFRFGCPRLGLGWGVAMAYLAALSTLAALAGAGDLRASIEARCDGWERPPWPRAGRRFSPLVEAVAA